MAGMFGRAPSALCHIFYYVVEFLDEKLAKFLYFDTARVIKNLDRYCAAIAAKEPESIEDVWGVIDGTIRPICRPSKGQQAMYKGHKSVHAMKFQTVVTPYGLISHLFGPIDGRRHDMLMLNESGFKQELENNAAFHNKLIYGDPAYGCTNVFCCPHKGCRVNAPQKQPNKAMSAVRVSVEWSYGEFTKYFSFLDYKRHQRGPSVSGMVLRRIYQVLLISRLQASPARCDNTNGHALQALSFLHELSDNRPRRQQQLEVFSLQTTPCSSRKPLGLSSSLDKASTIECSLSLLPLIVAGFIPLGAGAVADMPL